MSDQKSENGGNPSSGWRRLDVKHLEQFDKDVEASERDPKSNGDDTFHLLYESEENGNPDDSFQPIYQRERNALPAENSRNSGADLKPAGQAADRKADQNQIAETAERAYKEGFAKGEKEGFEAGKQKSLEQLNQLQTLMTELDGLWARLVGTYEKEIVKLVCRVAEKVILAKIDSDQETVKRSILHAFEMVPEPMDVTISLHPDDYEFIELVKEDIFQNIKALKNVEVVSNPSVGRGGCVVETRSGNVSVDIEERLARVQESLMDAYRLKET